MAFVSLGSSRSAAVFCLFEDEDSEISMKKSMKSGIFYVKKKYSSLVCYY